MPLGLGGDAQLSTKCPSSRDEALLSFSSNDRQQVENQTRSIPKPGSTWKYYHQSLDSVTNAFQHHVKPPIRSFPSYDARKLAYLTLPYSLGPSFSHHHSIRYLVSKLRPTSPLAVYSRYYTLGLRNISYPHSLAMPTIGRAVRGFRKSLLLHIDRTHRNYDPVDLLLKIEHGYPPAIKNLQFVPPWTTPSQSMDENRMWVVAIKGELHGWPAVSPPVKCTTTGKAISLTEATALAAENMLEVLWDARYQRSYYMGKIYKRRTERLKN